jgi:hypothetical protein
MVLNGTIKTAWATFLTQQLSRHDLGVIARSAHLLAEPLAVQVLKVCPESFAVRRETGNE